MKDYSAAIFIDTSVQLLRFIGGSDVKRQIDRQLSRFNFTVTSLVVRQEFKRRFLTDVRYLRDALRKNDHDCGETLRFINRKLGLPVNRRKLSICLDIFATGSLNGRGIPDAGEQFDLLLSSWLEFGLDFFDNSVGHVVRSSGCGCGQIEKLGPKKCITSGRCAIDDFVNDRQQSVESVKAYLKDGSRFPKTKEIQVAEQKLQDWLDNGRRPSSTNPCLSVGDLIIALESAGIPVFYTQNARESQHYCCHQEQTMIVLRDTCDETRLATDRHTWPTYT